MVKIILNKITIARQILINYISNMRYYLSKSNTVGSNKSKVIFDLDDLRVEPYYFLLIYSFHETGFNIVLKHNFMFIANIRKSGHFLFNLPGLEIKFNAYRDINPEDVVITDKKEGHINNKAGKKVHISFDVYSSKPKHQFFTTMPFFMSPDQYIYGYYRTIKTLRNSEKKMKVFFSGNQNRTDYNNSIFQDFFKLMNRIEVLDTLKNSLTPDEILIIDKKKKWAMMEHSFQNKFVLNQWTWSREHSENLDARVSNENWLKVLSKSQFFLATPGIRMPLCFNVTEAMSVGSIPIIQYPHYYNPPLKHMKNCIVFQNSNDLLNKIKLVLSLNEEIIKVLKNNVIDYYDTYLRLETFPNNIKQINQEKLTLLINATEVSYLSYIQSKSSA